MKILRYTLPLLLALAAAPAYAHFLWINKQQESSGDSVVQLCFAEVGEPGEAHLVDRLKDVPLLAYKAGEKPTQLKTEKQAGEKTGFFGAKGADDTVYTSSLDYGVISRGDKTFVLQYTAKYLDLASPESLKAIARAEHLHLDLVPSITGDEVEVTLLHDGKPVAAGSQVKVETPNVGIEELTTDAAGKVKFKLTEKGHYELRARYQIDTPGERDGKAYTHEMHYATLVMDVPKK